MQIDLTGKRALVTGGSRGVGAATARMLARAGADVGITYLTRAEEARSVVAELSGLGVEAWSHAVDLADPEAVDALFERVDQEFGGLDILVANAGVWPVEDAPIAEMSPEQWRRTLAVNLDGVFYAVRGAARRIRAGGRLVLVGSTAGQRGEAGHGDYAASKGALISLVKGVAVELAPMDVTVNCVAPGWIDTEMAALPYADGGLSRIESDDPARTRRVGRRRGGPDPLPLLAARPPRHRRGAERQRRCGALRLSGRWS